MDFATLYGNELDRELGTADRDQRFTLARRKAAINAAQLEFLERTECLQREVAIAIVDGTQEYDLESSITDFGWLAKQGVSIKIVSGTTTRYIEGHELEFTSVERLNHEEPGWRATPASTPTKIYLRRHGGAVNLGFHPGPDITGSDVWTAVVMAVVIPADMVADADEPFTLSSNAVKSLRPYHRALAHFAAFDLEKFRKDTDRGAVQLALFESYIERYTGRQKPQAGQKIRLARNYRRPTRRRVEWVAASGSGGAFDDGAFS